jgi:hypothetical protein
MSNPAAAVGAFDNTIPGAFKSGSLVAQAVAAGYPARGWGSVLYPIFTVFPPLRPAVATSSLYVPFPPDAKKFRRKYLVNMPAGRFTRC